MSKLKEIEEQLISLRAAFGNEEFTIKLNGAYGARLYFFFITDIKGVMYHDEVGSAEPFTVDVNNRTFDVWTDCSHFVHYDTAFKLWEIYFNKVVEQELLEDEEVFTLPEGFRDAMWDTVVDHIVEGKDYPGFIRELSEDEVDEMSDKEIYDHYCSASEWKLDDAKDEATRMINIVKDILDKEKMEGVLNE